MENEFEVGDKIQYRLYDEKGKAHWFDGVIHGKRSYETPMLGVILNVTYLVDTGRDERIDTYAFNPRDREIDKRVRAMVKTGRTVLKAVEEVTRHSDLPESSVEIETNRQPEQLELPAEHIRKA